MTLLSDQMDAMRSDSRAVGHDVGGGNSPAATQSWGSGVECVGMGGADRCIPPDDMSRLRRVVPLSLVLLVIVALGHSLPEQFLSDAQSAIRDNPRVIGETGWMQIWTTNYWGDRFFDGLYRPLTLTTFRIEHAIFGFSDRASWYGATNMMLHLLATLLLWRLAYALMPRSRRFEAAWLAAAVFAVHPWATAVVPNLVGRADLLALVAILAATMCYLQWYRRGRWGGRCVCGGRAGVVVGGNVCEGVWGGVWGGRVGERGGERGGGWLLAALLFWAAGLVSKESAVVWPAMLVMVHVLRRDRIEQRMFYVAGLIVAVGLLWLGIRTAILWPIGEPMTNAISNPLVIESVDVRVRTGVALLGSYFAQALLPIHMSADYSFNQYPVVAHWNDPRWLAALGIFASLAWLLRWEIQRGNDDRVERDCTKHDDVECGRVEHHRVEHGRVIVAGILFFFASLLPVSNLFFTIGTIRADRIGYLPLVGLALAIGSIGGLASIRSRRITMGVAVLILLILTLRTSARAQTWVSDDRFWSVMANDAPRSVKSNAAIATIWLNLNEPWLASAAIEPARQSWWIASQMPGDDYLFSWITYARALRINHRYDEAMAILREAESRENASRRRRELWLHWQGSLKSNRPYGQALLAIEIGRTLRELGDLEGAVYYFERATRVDMRVDAGAVAAFESAKTHAQLDHDGLARWWFNLAISHAPQRADYHAGYGQWAYERGDFSTAVSMLSLAIECGDISSETYAMLKQVYRDWLLQATMRGDRDAAQLIVERAQKRDRIHTITLQSVGLD